MQIADAMKVVEEERQRVLEEQAKNQREVGTPNHLSQARLSPLELQRVADMYTSDEIRGKTLRGEVDDFGTVPRAPSPEEQAVIQDAVSSLPRLPRAPLPWWCGALCRARDDMVNVALGVDSDPDECWLFLYAKQQPQEVLFLRLERTGLLARSGTCVCTRTFASTLTCRLECALTLTYLGAKVEVA